MRHSSLISGDKKYVLNEYVRYIHHISDKEYQKKTWIRGELPGTDFDETVCQFVDIGDPILANYKDFGITNDQYQMLKKFRNKFGAFWEANNWPSQFIDTLEWNEVVEMAKEVLCAFTHC